MDDTITTPGEEVKAPEGTVEALETVDDIVEAPKETVQETVPLSVYLELKKDLKDLKHEIKSTKESNQEKVEIAGVKELANKYPDVNEDFIKDILNSATKEAEKKLDEKYTPIIAKQEIKEKQIAFDTAFDRLFEKTIQDNPDLPKTIDKELVKELALTPKYRNVPLSDIMIKMYGSTIEGKSSSENEMRSGSDVVTDVVNFESITPDQKTAIMADPKVRAKYFSWLDTQVGR
jgi:hypothetical protein